MYWNFNETTIFLEIFYSSLVINTFKYHVFAPMGRTTKGLQDRNTSVTAGTTVENKGKLILILRLIKLIHPTDTYLFNIHSYIVLPSTHACGLYASTQSYIARSSPDPIRIIFFKYSYTLTVKTNCKTRQIFYEVKIKVDLKTRLIE
jgi:hypothetical protein